MFICKVPLRVSFIGGGSDFSAHFYQDDNLGAVLGTTINLYVYLTAVAHNILTENRFKLTYRNTDEADNYGRLNHPVAPLAFQAVGWNAGGVHVSTMSDVPAGTGLGSSSSFTVGLLHLLSSYQGVSRSAQQLAESAIAIERHQLHEEGGYQDQYHAAFGGFSLYNFSSQAVRIDKVGEFASMMSECMLLVPIGVSRKSTEIAKKIRKDISLNKKYLNTIAKLANDVYQEIQASKNHENSLNSLCKGMVEAWAIKKTLADDISNENVDNLIRMGLNLGARAAKLCGAGASGFVLFVGDPDQIKNVHEKLNSVGAFRITIENSGSRVIDF